MIRISFLLALLVCSFSAFAQVKLPKEYTCTSFKNGYGLSNGDIVFYKETLSDDLSDKEILDAYLADFTKTKDNLYMRKSKTQMLLEIVIPETLTSISLSANKDKAGFQKYSLQLLESIRKNRAANKNYFVKHDGLPCPEKK